jgi:hypothetical protein
VRRLTLIDGTKGTEDAPEKECCASQSLDQQSDAADEPERPYVGSSSGCDHCFTSELATGDVQLV